MGALALGDLADRLELNVLGGEDQLEQEMEGQQELNVVVVHYGGQNDVEVDDFEDVLKVKD